jgi:hypothetical protein
MRQLLSFNEAAAMMRSREAVSGVWSHIGRSTRSTAAVSMLLTGILPMSRWGIFERRCPLLAMLGGTEVTQLRLEERIGAFAERHHAGGISSSLALQGEWVLTIENLLAALASAQASFLQVDGVNRTESNTVFLS